MHISFSGGFEHFFNMVINLRVKTLDSQDHEFNVDDDVSICDLIHFFEVRRWEKKH